MASSSCHFGLGLENYSLTLSTRTQLEQASLMLFGGDLSRLKNLRQPQTGVTTVALQYFCMIAWKCRWRSASTTTLRKNVKQN